MGIRATRCGSALGARLEGLVFDGDEVPRDLAEQVRKAWLEHQVLFFPGLDPTPEQQLGLARVFGEPEAHGDTEDDSREYRRIGGHREIIELAQDQRTDFWHTDATFRPAPPRGSILCLREVPPAGGDTMWLSTTVAYARLPEAVKAMAEKLVAVHGHPPMTDTTTHPVVTTHPETGERVLFVNRGWTTGLEGMDPRQARPVLGLLFDLMEQPEHTLRWQWSPGDVAVWDNRCTMHYALRDYGEHARVGHRIIVQGEPPVTA